MEYYIYKGSGHENIKCLRFAPRYSYTHAHKKYMDCTLFGSRQRDSLPDPRHGFLLGFAKKDLTKVYPHQTTLNNILKDLTAVDLRYHSYSITAGRF